MPEQQDGHHGKHRLAGDRQKIGIGLPAGGNEGDTVDIEIEKHDEIGARESRRIGKCAETEIALEVNPALSQPPASKDQQDNDDRIADEKKARYGIGFGQALAVIHRYHFADNALDPGDSPTDPDIQVVDGTEDDHQNAELVLAEIGEIDGDEHQLHQYVKRDAPVAGDDAARVVPIVAQPDQQFAKRRDGSESAHAEGVSGPPAP